MEPSFHAEHERDLLPPELHTPAHHLQTPPATTADTMRSDNNPTAPPQDARRHCVGHPLGQDGLPCAEAFARGGGEKGSPPKSQEPPSPHAIHIVTQYYVPDDVLRAREVRCSSGSGAGAGGGRNAGNCIMGRKGEGSDGGRSAGEISVLRPRFKGITRMPYVLLNPFVKISINVV